MISVYLIGNVAFCSNMLAMPQLLNHWASRLGWYDASFLYDIPCVIDQFQDVRW